MSHQASTRETPSYMSEYWGAYSVVPATMEDEHGTITDMNTHQEVAVPATHPDFARRYGAVATRNVVTVAEG